MLRVEGSERLNQVRCSLLKLVPLFFSLAILHSEYNNEEVRSIRITNDVSRTHDVHL